MIEARKRLAMGGLVVAVGLMGAACDGRGGAGHGTAPEPASAATPSVQVTGGMTQTPAASVGSVKSLEGTGTQSSGNFSVTGAWKVVWSAGGPIEVRVISGETFQEIKVLKGSAGGEQTLGGGCVCYLEVSSASPYKVTVTDLPS